MASVAGRVWLTSLAGSQQRLIQYSRRVMVTTMSSKIYSLKMHVNIYLHWSPRHRGTMGRVMNSNQKRNSDIGNLVANKK